MGHNLPHLASVGRAYSAGRPWTPEELDAWLLLQRECHVNRKVAADYVRNGVMTVEDFDKLQKKDFKPKTLGEAHDEAEKELKKRGKTASMGGRKASPVAKK